MQIKLHFYQLNLHLTSDPTVAAMDKNKYYIIMWNILSKRDLICLRWHELPWAFGN